MFSSLNIVAQTVLYTVYTHLQEQILSHPTIQSLYFNGTEYTLFPVNFTKKKYLTLL